MVKTKIFTKNIVGIIARGGIGILPTDTLYGLVGRALNRDTVKRIYEVKGRDKNKPLIVLISSISDLKKCGIVVDEKTKKILQKMWPGKVSVIMPVKQKKFSYLHRNSGGIAFRMPDNNSLRKLLKKTGPLVAPSANPQGEAPATTITQAKNYFEECVDFYVDGGVKQSAPSTLVKLVKGKCILLRQGAVKL